MATPRTLALISMLSAPAAAAHPHIFIETGLELLFNEDGALEAVEISWAYDPLYTLLLLEDMDLDTDYDGVLTPDELERVQGFDMNWVDGFEGDFYIEADGPIALSAPEPVETRLENEMIVSVHRRALANPLSAAQPVTLRAYDPTYYTAYSLLGPVAMSGPEGCVVTVTPADIAAASDLLEELLFATPESELEENFPAVGASFADTVTLTCASG